MICIITVFSQIAHSFVGNLRLRFSLCISFSSCDLSRLLTLFTHPVNIRRCIDDSLICNNNFESTHNTITSSYCFESPLSFVELDFCCFFSFRINFEGVSFPLYNLRDQFWEFGLLVSSHSSTQNTVLTEYTRPCGERVLWHNAVRIAHCRVHCPAMRSC